MHSCSDFPFLPPISRSISVFRCSMFTLVPRSVNIPGMLYTYTVQNHSTKHGAASATENEIDQQQAVSAEPGVSQKTVSCAEIRDVIWPDQRPTQENESVYPYNLVLFKAQANTSKRSGRLQ
eukprot:COSAG02_NODE_840_length_16627_cov_11.279828_3_plen_122_part_00